jgi:ribonuclease HI
VTLNTLSKDRVVDWKWVKAHAGNKYNEIADRLATEAVGN